MIKIVACIGFIILGIIIDCGGVPTDHRGYIGAHYWHDPGAFRNGFKGFCSVFVTASFAFGGTELVGLCAAEAANPVKALPQATKQVFWRITFFYVLSLFIVGLIVPSDNLNLLNATGAHTKYSPFVIAINLAGIKVLPSIFNVVITISVLSVANSCTFASTRTMQALAMRGMAPRFLSYVDKAGRPLPCVLIQLLFGLLAFVNEATAGTTFFNWLLALSGLANFFVWCASSPFPCIFHLDTFSLKDKSLGADKSPQGIHLPIPHPLPPRLGSPRPLPRRTPLPSLLRGMGQLRRPLPQHPVSDCPILRRPVPPRRLPGRRSLFRILPRRSHHPGLVRRLENVEQRLEIVHQSQGYGFADGHEGEHRGVAGGEDGEAAGHVEECAGAVYSGFDLIWSFNLDSEPQVHNGGELVRLHLDDGRLELRL